MDGLNQPIVIDQGSGTLKAGFAGADHPSTYFPSYVGASHTPGSAATFFACDEPSRGKALSASVRLRTGRPKHTRVMAGAVEGDTFVGRKAQELRGLLRIK